MVGLHRMVCLCSSLSAIAPRPSGSAPIALREAAVVAELTQFLGLEITVTAALCRYLQMLLIGINKADQAWFTVFVNVSCQVSFACQSYISCMRSPSAASVYCCVYVPATEVIISPDGRVFYHRKAAEEHYGKASSCEVEH